MIVPMLGSNHAGVTMAVQLLATAKCVFREHLEPSGVQLLNHVHGICRLQAMDHFPATGDCAGCGNGQRGSGRLQAPPAGCGGQQQGCGGQQQRSGTLFYFMQQQQQHQDRTGQCLCSQSMSCRALKTSTGAADINGGLLNSSKWQ